MYLLYSIGLLLWMLLNLPFFVYQALVHKKYISSLRQRLGFLPPELKGGGPWTIWLHGCSVGEILSAQPLAFHFRHRFPDARIVVSTISLTGQILARERFANSADVFYFPLDLPPIVKRTLDHIQPHLVVILETEIWPNFVRECSHRGIPLVLANGRISPRSFPRYRLVRRLMQRLLTRYTLFLMRSKEDAERILALGAPPEKVQVTGDVKFDRDVVERAVVDSIAEVLDHTLALATGPPLLFAGSTNEGEEPLILEAFRRIRRQPGLEAVRLVLAPRHPERFEEVAKLLRLSGFSFIRRSQPAAAHPEVDVILLDSIGELAAAYRFATVVFMGGTLGTRGGQSILEPALYAKPIVVGPHMENFAHILEEFAREHAVVQLPDGTPEALTHSLTQALIELLKDHQKASAMGLRAQGILKRNRGAARLVAHNIVGAIYPPA